MAQTKIFKQYMSFKNRALLLIENDITIYRLILLGLFIASPSLHYLCYNNSYDPIWLRGLNCAFCLLALGISYGKNPGLLKSMVYVTICSYLFINNFVLLGINGFEHIYVFSAITIFIALTLFCKQRIEFVVICTLNIIAVVAAYYTAPKVAISVGVLIALLGVFTLIAYVSFLVMLAYNLQFKKAVNNIIQLNESLVTHAEKLRHSQQQLHALISSVNDTIFEFDENGICINVWFGAQTPQYLKPGQFLNKTFIEALGEDRAKPFLHVYEHVLQNRTSTSIEFASVFGEPSWFVAKASPVVDISGKYTKRISISVTDISEQKKRADALIENKNLLMQAQDIAKTGNWWYDSDAKAHFWSESLFKILEVDELPAGLSRFEYYMALIHPDDREVATNYFNNINAIAENSLVHKFITPRGNLKYLRVLRGEISQNKDGSLKRIVGIIQDITESKLAEKAVKVSQAELLEAQTIAKIGNWKWDSTQNMLTWSDEINSIYEIALTSAQSTSHFGKLLMQHIHPDDRYILHHLFKNGDSNGSSYEYRIITPKGNIKHISVITGKLMYREDGSVRKVIGTLQDITQRKQAEIDYRRTENKYRLVLETIKLAAVSLSADGKVIFCNKYLATLLGYSQMEILGMDWMANFVPDEHRTILTDWFKSNQIRAHYINPVICRHGELRTISWQNTVSYDENGNIKETTSIGEDITVQQKVRQELISAKEQAERSSHFKSEFLSIMSHEIRTPMNAVIGTTNLLLEENPKPEQLEYLNTLKFSSENLLAIINDILDYNKIEAGKLQLSSVPFNIHQLAQNIRQSFHSKAMEKNLDIELITDDGIPDFLMGDQTRLSQILINLVSNAVKFTHAGKVSILLQKQQISNQDVVIKFTVSDTGIGIAAENVAIVFDPFIQGPQTITHSYGGTGLGLAITKRLIELHESSIQVFSDLGKGTRFTFSIRFKVTTPVAEHINSDKNILLPPDFNGLNILVVDDSRMNLMIASKFLKKWKANVAEALNGQIAVDMVAANNYDMIIMDLQMPVMDGFEATSLIKQTHPDLPIIAFTADAMPETQGKAFEAGMCDYLTKPFVPDTLFEKISKHRKAVISDCELSK